MNESNWNAMSAPKKRKLIGVSIIVIFRYLVMFVGLMIMYDTPIPAFIMVSGGMVVGLVGLGIYIWGTVGEDRPVLSKVVSVLLSIGIFMGGWIGIVCIAASLILSLIAKKKSRQQDDQETDRW